MIVMLNSELIQLSKNKEKLLIEKGNKIESELEPDMRRAVLQAKEKVHLAG